MSKRHFSLFGLLLIFVLNGLGPVNAEKKEVVVLKALFDQKIATWTDVFSSEFLKAVPEKKIQEFVTLYQSKLGHLQEAIDKKGKFDLLFSSGKAPCTISFNEHGLVKSLWLGNWTLFDDTPNKLADEWKKLPGVVSVTVTRNGSDTILDLNGNSPLGVGSAFKLFILKAYRQALASGTLRVDEILPLRSEWFSLPSGLLQSWPAGTPITLETYANLMISLSDNTATDHLLNRIGRANVEAVAPQRVRPFLGTMEMFRLKYGAAKYSGAFLKADEKGKRELLTRLASESISVADISEKPVFINKIEWLISTAELCRVIYELRKDPAIAINPGLVQKKAWALCGYKGGSETGVLNYTLVLQKTPSSDIFCISATINDSEKSVDEETFTELFIRFLSLIETGKLG
ncbi:MAG: serine hydrolase [Candidatus Riflebacteria bacterium]|nr:serine hydrolase [Candidatus Riflebacteria bacterium]